MDNGEGLGAVGAWNFLFRLGFNPQWLDASEVRHLTRGDVVLAVADVPISDESSDALKHALQRGVTVITSGSMQSWSALFPEGTRTSRIRCEYPHAALAWLLDDDRPSIISPPGWSYDRVFPGRDVHACGRVAAIRGERQTPDRALITPLPEAPAMVRAGCLCFLNGNPFAALQSWLQGQENLGPWLHWRHRLFWLDEYVADVARVLRRQHLLPNADQATAIGGLPETTVVLRHDLDHSRDTSYLDLERSEGLASVHAVLRDRSTAFWLDTLRGAQDHEIAFHYSTARYSRWREAVRERVGLRKRSYRPDRHAIVGDGLLRQVRWAKRRHIGINTLHRHLPFIIYPEWVDAMHTVLTNEPEVLGGSSLFRGHVLRWGSDELDGAVSTGGEFPDSQFPYWFPFKLAHAALGGMPLRGWETTSMMELEPELFDQLLSNKIPDLPQRLFTINYHPAHARRQTFVLGGSLEWWRKILQVLRDHNAKVLTLRDVYSRLNAQIEARAGLD
jgi:hypothetical protein